MTRARSLVLVFGLMLVATAAPGAAVAAAPANDHFADARTIDPSSLPFTDSVVVDEATAEPGEPGSCPWPGAQSVWYAVMPTADGPLRFGFRADFYFTTLAVYRQTGQGFGGLTNVACAGWWYGTAGAVVEASAGEIYYVQAGSVYQSSGTITVSVEQVPRPVNDAFADATVVGSLPYAATADTSAASLEPGERTSSCGPGGPTVSVWYRFTPATDGWVTASTLRFGRPIALAAYSGDGVGSLVELSCRYWPGVLTTRVRAGEPISFQLAGDRGQFSFDLDVAPDPVPWFFPGTEDPSTFDALSFWESSWDPGDVGIASRSWDFGDGTTSDAQGGVSHRYAVDGDYVVTLTVTTGDGRTASASRTVVVRTHDVAIEKLTVPQSARAGHTRQITVGLTNTRYPETVEVTLLKSTPGGWEQVGLATQHVPLRSANRTTAFAFNYTFTSADAELGKVTFQAVATIQGARDALPADNTVVALPTNVG